MKHTIGVVYTILDSSLASAAHSEEVDGKLERIFDCDFAVIWDPPWNHQTGLLNLDALTKALLDQLGLELVPSREPIEMLVVEKVR